LTTILKRKINNPVTYIAHCLLFGRPAEAQYGGGSGTAEEQYLICTAEQMNAIGADENDWAFTFAYVLTDHII